MNIYECIFTLKGNVVVITGATGQLGRILCQSLKDAGCVVIGLDCNDTIPKDQEGITLKQLDITNHGDVQRIFDDIFMEYGKIDIIINNAGVSTFEPFENRPEERFNWVMDVNLKGTFFCIQRYVELYDRHNLKKGAIINIASMYGIISPDFRIYTDCPRKNSEIYGATKAGIIQMTKYFAVHLADRNIRVNAISPGGIFNPDDPQGEDFINNYSYRCPMKRLANADEMIGAVIYLSSDASSYTTGSNIVIDGGMTCW